MATISVRKLDDELMRHLKKRAASNNRSLGGEVRHILKQVIADDIQAKREAFLVLSTQLRRETQGKVKMPSKILIREDRDQRY